ncbi:MAG: hypothetical protein Q8O57_00465, partial [Kiritimatiellota bacterium]|nr:hypothetical protein [Kiritimatiellota bacterium]
ATMDAPHISGGPSAAHKLALVVNNANTPTTRNAWPETFGLLSIAGYLFILPAIFSQLDQDPVNHKAGFVIKCVQVGGGGNISAIKIPFLQLHNGIEQQNFAEPATMFRQRPYGIHPRSFFRSL